MRPLELGFKPLLSRSRLRQLVIKMLGGVARLLDIVLELVDLALELVGLGVDEYQRLLAVLDLLVGAGELFSAWSATGCSLEVCRWVSGTRPVQVDELSRTSSQGSGISWL